MGGFGDLDNDLLMKVLSPLPAKTLARCKSVCKAWFQVISDRAFVRLQLQQQTQEQLCGFFFQARYHYVDEDIAYSSFIPVDSSVLHEKVRHDGFEFLPEVVTVQSVSNGLVCCRTCLPCPYPYTYVCNPLNKEWVSFRCRTRVDRLTTFALAFDPVRDLVGSSTHFKVVRVNQTEVDVDGMDGQPCYLFEIYSSRTREWRVSKELCCRKNESPFNSGVWINGVIYWLPGDQILTFNVENEFSWLVSAPFPTSELGNVPEICIGESEGQLHYIVLSASGFQVWALEDVYDSKWVIKLSMTLEELENVNRYLFDKVVERVPQSDLSWVSLLAFHDGLLLMRVSTRVLLYNIDSGQVQEICSLSSLGTFTYSGPLVIPYTMTLVPFL